MDELRRGSALFGQQSPRLPQFREEFLVECMFQIRCYGASTRSHAGSNDALDQLNMTQSPAHDQFVELRQSLAHIDPIAVAGLILIEREHRTRPGRKLLSLARVFFDLQLSHGAQRPEKYVMHRGLAQPSLQLRIRFPSRTMVAQHLFVLQSAQKLNLAELFGLKSAGRLESSAKGQKVSRQHRLENGELFDQNPRNFRATP